MFRDTRRKTMRNRILFSVMGVLVMSFGIWLNFHSGESNSETEEAVSKISVEEESETEDNDNSLDDEYKTDDSDINTETEADDADEDERTDTNSGVEAYLIKETDGVVKVFLCKNDGTEQLYFITSIPFELLSESDQQLLSQGVEIKTEEDLGKFLENFDS